MSDEIWKWNVNLAWELFTSSVYCYRKAINSKFEHQRHMYYKNGLLSAVTSVEVYINQWLLHEEKWTNQKIKSTNIENKFEFLDVDNNLYKTSKNVRNKYLIHYKDKDHRYYDKINETSLLESIESAQEIIAIINFNKKRIFPYWITGINFINPSHNNDISFTGDFEFWSHLKSLGCLNKEIYDMYGNMIYCIEDYNDYKSLYFELWNKMKEENFIFEFVKDKRFPMMPVLSIDFWD